jgi:inner membrane protein
MDNLTHSFVGWALGRAGLDRFGTWATPTLIVAANLPDAELPLLFGDRAMFLTYHRGITHSFCGFVVEGLALSLLVCGLLRWRKKPAPPFLTVLLVALIGLLSHLLLDFLNSYGVRPFLPFDATWFYGDLIFILDPWTWLILAGGLFLGSRVGREAPALSIFWMLFAALAATIIVLAASRAMVPWTVPIVWLAGAAAVGLASVCVRAWRPAVLARAALLTWTLYLCSVCFGSRTVVNCTLETFQLSGGNPSAVTKTGAIPRPGVPWHFNAILQTESDVYVYRADALARSAELVRTVPRNMNYVADSALRTSRQYVAWATFARFPCCACGVPDTDPNQVFVYDARFSSGVKDNWMALPLPAQKRNETCQRQ